MCFWRRFAAAKADCSVAGRGAHKRILKNAANEPRAPMFRPMRHVLAGEVNFAFVQSEVAGQGAEQRRFAGAVATEDNQENRFQARHGNRGRENFMF